MTPFSPLGTTVEEQTHYSCHYLCPITYGNGTMDSSAESGPSTNIQLCIYVVPGQMSVVSGGLSNRTRGREGAFPVTVRGHRERVFHLSAAATNMPAHLFTLSLVPASSANSYRNILAGSSLFSFFTKDLSVCVGVCVCVFV